MQLEITDKALKQLIDDGVGADAPLRLSVKPGGCAGMSYDMVLDEQIHKADRIIYRSDLVTVVADPLSAPHLDGLRIDYSDDLVESGYRLTNPNAKHTCGCGSSFSCG